LAERFTLFTFTDKITNYDNKDRTGENEILCLPRRNAAGDEGGERFRCGSDSYGSIGAGCDDTINYAAVYAVVKEQMDIPSKLIEHVAGRILYALKERFPQLAAVELKLSKLNPPFGGDVHSASIILGETFS